MQLIKAIGLNMRKRYMISLVGGGGKTTTMYRLARELKVLGKRVLVTTTTAIFYPTEDQYDHLYVTRSLNELMRQSLIGGKGTITIMGKYKMKGGKLKGIEPEWVDSIEQSSSFDMILIEADGAKCKPMKAPLSHEPVIPPKSHMVIGCIGLDSYKKTINEKWVHRPSVLAKVVGQDMDTEINYDTYSKLIAAQDGLFKGCPQNSEKVVLFNKMDLHNEKEIFPQFYRELVENNGDISKVLVGHVQEDNPIVSVVNRS
ncbi:putative selenium-dependent hydroxylase accessory protein YqeC [Vallitalea pronyensis]|uniref:Putative selenium-dependent hydroxylase accessory protein YqeC n=1 Tax=Vallitalea pronyensis TaxID=1348613 RepID=A0A8J8MKF7_9FIRM|nr:selenium cofactor biosynthesis protein YqeC [Vallitalea pronyensis]QUI23492.1 putative selenium-dependent hydroxylase accessory protein YqeC [Vallitalea pronyensis]